MGRRGLKKNSTFSVRDNIEDIDGAGAVALWHEYIRGDENALRRLITYNRADIAAMGAILDETLGRLQVQLSLFSNDVRFVNWSAPSNWKELPENLATVGGAEERKIDLRRSIR